MHKLKKDLTLKVLNGICRHFSKYIYASTWEHLNICKVYVEE